MCYQEHSIGSCGHFMYGGTWMCDDNPRIPGTNENESEPVQCKNWKSVYKANTTFYPCDRAECREVDWSASPYLPDPNNKKKTNVPARKESSGLAKYRMSIAHLIEDNHEIDAIEDRLPRGSYVDPKDSGLSKNLDLESGNDRNAGLGISPGMGSTVSVGMRFMTIGQGLSSGRKDLRSTDRNSISAQQCAEEGIEIRNSRYEDYSDEDTVMVEPSAYPIKLSIEEEDGC